jgi:sterol desaturase/sphingolipid hydroxylase (fatty acid hydroxylase superfamily)
MMFVQSDLTDWKVSSALPGLLGQLLEPALAYLGSAAFAIDLSLITGVLFVDRMWRGPGQSCLNYLSRLSRSARADLLCFGLTSTLLMGLLITVLSFRIGGRVNTWLSGYVPLGLVRSVGNPLLQALIFLVILDFLSYWRHRFSHEWKWWWQLHKYHHAATELTALTSYRLHPADMAAHELFVAVPMAVVGVPLESYAVLRSAVFMQGLLNHSLLEWRLGALGGIVVSPWAHRIHHSTVPEHVNKNYGGVFSIWDRLFGSWYAGERLNTEAEIGVPDNPYNRRSLLVEFLLPLRLSAGVIVRQLGGLIRARP